MYVCTGEANQLRDKLNMKFWEEEVVGAGTPLKGQVRLIRRHVSLLVDFYGLKRKRDLLTFKVQGRQLSEQTIVRLWKGVLRRIETRKLKVLCLHMCVQRTPASPNPDPNPNTH